MSEATVHVERGRRGRAKVILDRAPHNAVDAACRAKLAEVLTELSADEELRAVIVASRGKDFCVGNDVNELLTLDADGADRLLGEWDELGRLLREMPAVTIAQIQGHALGGGFELALSCDLRVVAADAKLACTATNFSLVMSTHTLIRNLPQPLASELALTARMVDGETAERIGLVNHSVPAAELESRTEELASGVADRSAAAIHHGKRLMRLAHTTDRDVHDTIQREAFRDLSASPEHMAAVQAFLQRDGRGEA